MNKSIVRLLVVVVTILVVGLIVWFTRFRPAFPSDTILPPVISSSSNQSALKTTNVPDQNTTSAGVRTTNNGGVGAYPLWRGGRATDLSDPRWEIRRERQARDPEWDGKMAIEFYGKVVDEKGQPIADAKVELTWTDLSPAGSTQREINSDPNGLFSILGIKGKRLLVMVTKNGYETSRIQNHFGFEYASFGDEQYHEPDANNPVLFHLRKKGDAEPLIRREREMKVTVGVPVTIDVNGQTQLQFLLQSNVYPRRGKWEAALSVQNGGIVPATDEFIIEAPLIGYQSSMPINPSTPKSPTWDTGYQGGSFYLKAGENYHRHPIGILVFR